MELIQYDDKFSLPPFGFSNIGFTCYFNSLMQALLSCPQFVETVLRTRNTKDTQFLEYLVEFIKHTRQSTVGAHECGPILWRAFVRDLLEKSSERQFANGQQCAAEAFSHVMNVLEQHEDIQKLFTYRLRSSLVCPQCQNAFSHKYSMNNIFFVDSEFLNKNDGELDKYLISTSDETDADCVCSSCGDRSSKTIVSKTTMLPEILFVMFKKYKFDVGSQHGEKQTIEATIPEKINFRGKNGILEYSAVAQIEHAGPSIDSGHYYAICKRQGGWYVLNDTHVSPSRFNLSENTYIVIYNFMNIIV